VKATDPHVCPNCGERVTMFAAGCSICGADLDPHRAEAHPLRRLFGRIRNSRGRRRTVAGPMRPRPR
jgi:hypothetical protein